MAQQVITTSTYKTLTGITTTADDAKYDAICRAVDATIKKYVRSNIFQPAAAYTLYLDAPTSRELILPQKPVQLTGLVILRHPDAKGDPTLFDAATDTLTLYTDYLLECDRDDPTQSTSGIVRNLTGLWGIHGEPAFNALANRYTPDWRALKVTYVGGLASCPADLQMAAALAVTLFSKQIKPGFLKASESWNGYSTSYLSNMIQNGIIQHPDVWQMVQKYSPTAGFVFV